MSANARCLVVAAAALGFVAVSAQAAPPPVSFAAPQQYATGANGAPGWSETTVVKGDFNNDGQVDIISTDYLTFPQKAPLLQLNLGSGVFQSPGTRLPAAAAGAGALASGDFNGDGNIDLMTSHTTSVKVFLGNGNGTFNAGATYLLFSAGQEDMVTLDVNNDSKQDVVAITRYGIRVMIGNGNGGFTLLSPQVVAGIFPSAIDKARFNSDNNADLLLIDGAGQIIQLLGNGNGTFTRSGSGVAGLILGTGLAADFNHDGIDDAVALPEFNAGLRNAVVFISNGQGGFVNPFGTYYDGGLGPVSGEIADLNNDGNPDIIASDTVGGKQVVLLGNGDGSFTQGGAFSASFSCQTPVIADFNFDGKTDIATVGINMAISSQLGTLSVLINTTP